MYGEIYARIPEKAHQFRTYLRSRRLRVGSSRSGRHTVSLRRRGGERLRGGGPADRQGCGGCVCAGVAVLLVSEARKIMAGNVEGATERDACAILAKALELGSADAASELGRAYLRGFGVKHSESTGLRLLRKGTEGGSAVGARYLADYYFDNDDPDRALSWLSKAADLGDTRARTELARA